MKSSLFLLAFLFHSALSNAQFRTIAEGTPFDEPETGNGKMIQLKNGNTMFLYFHKKDGIDVQVYDDRHHLHGKYKSYILFNDLEKNEESEKKGKITTIQNPADCDGFYFLLGGDETLVPRQYVFGKEDKRRDHNLAIFTMSDYDRERNVYATLKLEREGRSRQVMVVWLQPQ